VTPYGRRAGFKAGEHVVRLRAAGGLGEGEDLQLVVPGRFQRADE
jgi:hypothetical protein